MARAVIDPALALATLTEFELPTPGASKFCMLKILNDSKRNWRFHPSLDRGTLLNIEKSILNTAGPLNGFFPRLPNVPDGATKAHGLNQVWTVRVASAASPPCEIVFWHFGLE